MNDELKERVERLAKEAGFDTDDGEIVAPKCYYQDAMDVRELLQRFSQAVARDCAKLVEPSAEHRAEPSGYQCEYDGVALLDDVAASIRAHYSIAD